MSDQYREPAAPHIVGFLAGLKNVEINTPGVSRADWKDAHDDSLPPTCQPGRPNMQAARHMQRRAAVARMAHTCLMPPGDLVTDGTYVCSCGRTFLRTWTQLS